MNSLKPLQLISSVALSVLPISNQNTLCMVLNAMLSHLCRSAGTSYIGSLDLDLVDLTKGSLPSQFNIPVQFDKPKSWRLPQKGAQELHISL